MLEKNEEIFAELIKKYRSSEKNRNTEGIKEDIIYSVAKTSNLLPNLKKGNPLSMMEMLCLIFMVAEKEPDKCAKLLNISPNSIKTYEQRVRYKLGTKSRANSLYVALVKKYILLDFQKE